MTTDERPIETHVSEQGRVTIPVNIRNRLDIQPGDTLKWHVDDEDGLIVDVLQQRYGAFEDDDMKADMGSNGIESHDLASYHTPTDR